MKQTIIDFFMNFGDEIAGLSISTQVILLVFSAVTLGLLTKKCYHQFKSLTTLINKNRERNKRLNNLIAEAEDRLQKAKREQRIPVMVEGYSDYQNNNLKFK